ncbi:transposase [Parabacteroides sp. APC149_11_2_Y6]
MSYDEFLRFIFPDGMFDYFELSDFQEKPAQVEIYFEEKNIHPTEYTTDKLESKVFYEQVRMHDYPMRGRTCLLFIKKRRWFNHRTGKYVSRNWKLVAEGTQITTEFASFLKALDRLSSSKH